MSNASSMVDPNLPNYSNGSECDDFAEVLVSVVEGGAILVDSSSSTMGVDQLVPNVNNWDDPDIPHKLEVQPMSSIITRSRIQVAKMSHRCRTNFNVRFLGYRQIEKMVLALRKAPASAGHICSGSTHL